MTLTDVLKQRAETGRPLRVGLIGAGKFGTMFLSQARQLDGLHVMGVADLNLGRVRENMSKVGWPAAQIEVDSVDAAIKTGGTLLSEDAEALIAGRELDVLIEATGHPAVGVRHAQQAIEQGVHVIMVNVEADVLAGPYLASCAAAAGVVYSLAYGDQPALICELVEWARACGFEVVCAGKGTKYLPEFHASTPDTVWSLYGLDARKAKLDHLNPRMFNSFLDGTKSAIEMAAVANATGLAPQGCGLGFPPCGIDTLQDVLIPSRYGGVLEHSGTVEVTSCLTREGQPVSRDFRWGVYVTIEASSRYVEDCFSDYGLPTDASGRFAAMYRPFHLVGLELGISVLKVGLRGEATGSPTGFRGDVVAVAKRALDEGELLDGEGGHTVFGVLRPARQSVAEGLLPIGLAHNAKLNRTIAADQVVRYADVELDETDPALHCRRQLEGSNDTPGTKS